MKKLHLLITLYCFVNSLSASVNNNSNSNHIESKLRPSVEEDEVVLSGIQQERNGFFTTSGFNPAPAVVLNNSYETRNRQPVVADRNSNNKNKLSQQRRKEEDGLRERDDNNRNRELSSILVNTDVDLIGGVAPTLDPNQSIFDGDKFYDNSKNNSKKQSKKQSSDKKSTIIFQGDKALDVKVSKSQAVSNNNNLSIIRLIEKYSNREVKISEVKSIKFKNLKLKKKYPQLCPKEPPMSLVKPVTGIKLFVDEYEKIAYNIEAKHLLAPKDKYEILDMYKFEGYIEDARFIIGFRTYSWLPKDITEVLIKKGLIKKRIKEKKFLSMDWKYGVLKSYGMIPIEYQSRESIIFPKSKAKQNEFEIIVTSRPKNTLSLDDIVSNYRENHSGHNFLGDNPIPTTNLAHSAFCLEQLSELEREISLLRTILFFIESTNLPPHDYEVKDRKTLNEYISTGHMFLKLVEQGFDREGFVRTLISRGYIKERTTKDFSVYREEYRSKITYAINWIASIIEDLKKPEEEREIIKVISENSDHRIVDYYIYLAIKFLQILNVKNKLKNVAVFRYLGDVEYEKSEPRYQVVVSFKKEKQSPIKFEFENKSKEELELTIKTLLHYITLYIPKLKQNLLGLINNMKKKGLSDDEKSMFHLYLMLEKYLKLIHDNKNIKGVVSVQQAIQNSSSKAGNNNIQSQDTNIESTRESLTKNKRFVILAKYTENDRGSYFIGDSSIPTPRLDISGSFYPSNKLIELERGEALFSAIFFLMKDYYCSSVYYDIKDIKALDQYLSWCGMPIQLAEQGVDREGFARTLISKGYIKKRTTKDSTVYSKGYITKLCNAISWLYTLILDLKKPNKEREFTKITNENHNYVEFNYSEYLAGRFLLFLNPPKKIKEVFIFTESESSELEYKIVVNFKEEKQPLIKFEFEKKSKEELELTIKTLLGYIDLYYRGLYNQRLKENLLEIIKKMKNNRLSEDEKSMFHLYLMLEKYLKLIHDNKNIKGAFLDRRQVIQNPRYKAPNNNIQSQDNNNVEAKPKNEGFFSGYDFYCGVKLIYKDDSRSIIAPVIHSNCTQQRQSLFRNCLYNSMLNLGKNIDHFNYTLDMATAVIKKRVGYYNIFWIKLEEKFLKYICSPSIFFSIIEPCCDMEYFSSILSRYNIINSLDDSDKEEAEKNLQNDKEKIEKGVLLEIKTIEEESNNASFIKNMGGFFRAYKENREDHVIMKLEPRHYIKRRVLSPKESMFKPLDISIENTLYKVKNNNLGDFVLKVHFKVELDSNEAFESKAEKLLKFIEDKYPKKKKMLLDCMEKIRKILTHKKILTYHEVRDLQQFESYYKLFELFFTQKICSKDLYDNKVAESELEVEVEPEPDKKVSKGKGTLIRKKVDNRDLFVFGQQWRIVNLRDAKHLNLMRECLDNEHCKITEKSFWCVVVKSKRIVKGDFSGAGCNRRNHYARLMRQNKVSVKLLVALKLYSDIDSLQRVLRQSFRYNVSDTVEKQKSFFHWRSALQEAFLKFTEISRAPKNNWRTPKRLYHGTSKVLCIDKFSGVFHGPISTTTDLDVARSFAGKNGMILVLIINPSTYTPLDISWLSDYADEKEYLLFDHDIELETWILASDYDEFYDYYHSVFIHHKNVKPPTGLLSVEKTRLIVQTILQGLVKMTTYSSPKHTFVEPQLQPQPEIQYRQTKTIDFSAKKPTSERPKIVTEDQKVGILRFLFDFAIRIKNIPLYLRRVHPNFAFLATVEKQIRYIFDGSKETKIPIHIYHRLEQKVNYKGDCTTILEKFVKQVILVFDPL